ncbi:MAG: ribose 5-phosphate isomerase A [archaeon]
MSFEKLDDRLVELLIDKYIKHNDVVAFGSSIHSERFVKKMALKAETENLHIKIVPTSARIAEIAHSLGLNIVSINDAEIDISIEFAEIIDNDFNFVKRDTLSLVRDKMIAQSAAKLIAISQKENFVKHLYGIVPFEITQFGWKRTLAQLEQFGASSLRKQDNKASITESGNYLADVDIRVKFLPEDIDYAAKNIPGVLETGLFIGCADKALLYSAKGIEVKGLMHDKIK